MARLSTTHRDPTDRLRLGRAVAAARESAGFDSRQAFVDATPGVNKSSLDLLESGKEGVGGKVLRAIARALPGWTEDTPARILEGQNPPEPPRPILAPQSSDGDKPDFPSETLWSMVRAGYAGLPDVEEYRPEQAEWAESELRNLARRAVRAEAREQQDGANRATGASELVQRDE